MRALDKINNPFSHQKFDGKSRSIMKGEDFDDWIMGQEEPNTSDNTYPLEQKSTTGSTLTKTKTDEEPNKEKEEGDWMFQTMKKEEEEEAKEAPEDNLNPFSFGCEEFQEETAELEEFESGEDFGFSDLNFYCDNMDQMLNSGNM